jgi:hypothetical protein
MLVRTALKVGLLAEEVEAVGERRKVGPSSSPADYIYCIDGKEKKHCSPKRRDVHRQLQYQMNFGRKFMSRFRIECERLLI